MDRNRLVAPAAALLAIPVIHGAIGEWTPVILFIGIGLWAAWEAFGRERSSAAPA